MITVQGNEDKTIFLTRLHMNIVNEKYTFSLLIHATGKSEPEGIENFGLCLEEFNEQLEKEIDEFEKTYGK